MRGRRERDVLDPEVRDLLHPRASVVEQQQQRMVSKGVAAFPRQVFEECPDLIAIHEAHFGQGRPLRRNRRDPLANVEPLREATADVLEEDPQCGEPVIRVTM